jgi:hypothetical protein
LVAAGNCAGDPLEPAIRAYPSESDQNNGFVTIFRESHFVGMGIDAKIKVKGLPYGYVLNGSGIRIGLPPGTTSIDVYTVMDFGHLSVPLTVESGKEYYLELAQQPNMAFTGGAVGYLLSTRKANVSQFCGGGWCAAVEDAETALPKLEKIHLKAR